MSTEDKPSFPKRLLSLLSAPFSKSKVDSESEDSNSVRIVVPGGDSQNRCRSPVCVWGGGRRERQQSQEGEKKSHFTNFKSVELMKKYNGEDRKAFQLEVQGGDVPRAGIRAVREVSELDRGEGG